MTYNDSDSDFMSEEEVRSKPIAKKKEEEKKAAEKKKVPKEESKVTKRKKKAKIEEEDESVFENEEEEDDSKEQSEEESETEVIYAKDITKGSSIVIHHPKGSPFPDAISPLTMEFLAGLAENNNRDYMHLHAKEWVAVKKDFIDFCGLVMSELHQVDPTIRQDEPKDTMYRQNRDLRFSNDKRPYKTFLSAAFSQEGRKFLRAGYFISIEPNNKTMIAAGIWQPRKEMLQSIRDNIMRHGDLFKESLATDAIKEVFDGKYGVDILEDSDRLKVAPKGVSKDHPEIELLRYRSFAVRKMFTDEEVMSAGFLDKTMDVFEALVPFVAVINSWV